MISQEKYLSGLVVPIARDLNTTPSRENKHGKGQERNILEYCGIDGLQLFIYTVARRFI
jgi:hypothetical protein